MKKLLILFLISLPLLCLGQENINYELTTLAGVRSGDQIEINWIVNTEDNNDYYILWVSKDAKEWNKLYTTPNKRNSSNYRYNLKSSLNLYFKLTQINFDKTITNMGLVFVDDGEQKEEIDNYKLYDLQGRETFIENKGLKVQYHNGEFDKKIFTY